MKNARSVILAFWLLLGAVVRTEGAAAPIDLEQRLRTFAAEKEEQARVLAHEHSVKVAPEIWEFFQAAKAGKWAAVTNLFEQLAKRAGQYAGAKADPAVTSPVWSAPLEVVLGVGLFLELGPKLTGLLIHDLTSGISKGAIYLGGTDPGRGLPTAFSESHVRGDPFFTLTQNALADAHYRKYLHSTYGKQIYVPTEDDAQECFATYVSDAGRRRGLNQLKPGEQVEVVTDKVTGQARVEVSGQVAVMSINALLVKTVFEKNPQREFFLEESFPLDWMYPHLVPHGAILKLQRRPPADLDQEVLRKDRAFWAGRVKHLLGTEIPATMTLKEVCAFVERVQVRKELQDFAGDKEFLASPEAQRIYAKLRGAIAGTYVYRAHASQDGTRARMLTEADHAFRQAFALCPSSAEIVFRYVNKLSSEGRFDDAVLVVKVAGMHAPDNGSFKAVREQLERLLANPPKLFPPGPPKPPGPPVAPKLRPPPAAPINPPLPKTVGIGDGGGLVQAGLGLR